MAAKPDSAGPVVGHETHEGDSLTSRRVVHSLWIILVVVVALITLVGGFRGLEWFVDQRVQEAITDEAFVREVASHVRPYVIFDKDGTIHADMGAMQYLDDIRVELLPFEQGEQTMRITIVPKEHLAYTPILDPIGAYEVTMTSSRGERHNFIYELVFVMWHGDEKERARFRLEILR